MTRSVLVVEDDADAVEVLSVAIESGWKDAMRALAGTSACVSMTGACSCSFSVKIVVARTEAELSAALVAGGFTLAVVDQLLGWSVGVDVQARLDAVGIHSIPVSGVVHCDQVLSKKNGAVAVRAAVSEWVQIRAPRVLVVEDDVDHLRMTVRSIFDVMGPVRVEHHAMSTTVPHAGTWDLAVVDTILIGSPLQGVDVAMDLLRRGVPTFMVTAAMPASLAQRLSPSGVDIVPKTTEAVRTAIRRVCGGRFPAPP